MYVFSPPVTARHRQFRQQRQLVKSDMVPVTARHPSVIGAILPSTGRTMATISFPLRGGSLSDVHPTE
jgi:hypothetical protein